MQTGTVSRLRFWRRSWGFKNLHEVEYCAFLEAIRLCQQVGCARNRLQFCTVLQNQKSFPWTQDWGWTLYPRLIWDLIVAVLYGNTYRNNQERRDPHKFPTRKKFHWKIDDLDNVDLFPQTCILLVRKLCCMCLKTTKKWSRWSFREEDRQWDMFPEPTELLLIGWFGPQSPNQIHWHQERIRRLFDKGNYTRDEWNHLLCLFNISHFGSINSLDAMSKRTQEDAGEERVTAKSKPMMNLV